MASHSPPRDLECAADYAPIAGGPTVEPQRIDRRLLLALFFTSLIIVSICSIAFISNREPSVVHSESSRPVPSYLPSRSAALGVSEKVFQPNGVDLRFAWTNAMLSWQRTGYHFQPVNNWMNDPNGPLFHKGWYHLFYQHNPDAAVWGTISWGHAVSRDLIHWLYLPFALVPDQWYDINGVWTGSATTLPDGSIVILYTGDTNRTVQVQCLAVPANISDPLLLDWVKHSSNPILTPPPGIKDTDFRDPTTAWLSPSGDRWRITIGSKVNKTGISMIYETSDFVKYELLDGYLHAVPGTGMWECIDFYPISTVGKNGLDTSANGPGVKHVLKASLDDDKNDYYALGTYDPFENRWRPDDPALDVGIGLRYDYGEYYASKTFYDQDKKRRILWGWIRETDAEQVDVLKGWASVQCIPRTVVFDQKTGTNILQWPVVEVESLRRESFEYSDVKLEPGSIVPIEIDSSSQLDIVASFELDEAPITAGVEVDSDYSCSTSGGAARRGVLGPFGIVVLADEKLTELTPIYFYIAKQPTGKLEYHFCADELRSSTATDVHKLVYGSSVPVLDGEKLAVRLLADHSIIESFAQGGRRVITSRAYPTKANGGTRVLLFNNATDIGVTAAIKIWKMDSAYIRPFPLDHAS